ncbi:MAG: ABC transporter permease [Chloroflexi bacterium]|nr:ABC transporter permease [Chloroflexota bacterium]
MRTLSITRKDLLILVKDRGALVFSFLLPLVFILAFSLAQVASESSGSQGLELVVVDSDQGPVAQTLLAGLNAGGVRTGLREEAQASQMLADGDLSRYLVIPAGFSAVALDHPATLRLVTHPDANAQTTQAVLMVIRGVAGDMALKEQLVATFVQMGEMMRLGPPEYQVFTSDVTIAQAESQWAQSAERPLISIDEAVPGGGGEGIAMTSTQMRVPGLTVLFVFLTAQSVAASIYTEKRQGSFRRLLAAPLGRAALLVGKMLPNMIVALAQIVVVFAAAVWVLPLLGLEPLSLGHDPLGLLVTSVLVALCSTSVGILIAGLAHTEAQVGGLSAVLLWVMAAVGGSFFPTFLMKGPFRAVSQVVPHSWALRAYNGLLVEGGMLRDVAPELAVLAGFTIVFFAIGLWRFDFE